MRVIKCAFLILGILMYNSCIDPIEFEVPNEFSDSLVVQGRVVKSDPSYIEVNRSRLFDFSPESRQPVSVQEVTIIDDQGNELELETRTPGVYRQLLLGSSPIQAEVGRGYMIRVRTFDGRLIESTMDVMPPNLGLRNLNLSRVEEMVINRFNEFETQPRIQLSVDTDVDPQSDGGLFWDIRSIYKVTDSGIDALPSEIIRTCYVNTVTNISDIYVLDPDFFSESRIDDFNLVKIPVNSNLAEGYFFEVRQFSLSAGAFEYWNGIDILSEREGNVFDRPVGEVSSNLTNVDDPSQKVFGYFFASEEILDRTKVPEELYVGVSTSCPAAGSCFNGPGGSCTCQPCCDCRKVTGASEAVPSFWVE